MNYGLYISSSAVSVNMARQEVLANNLANVNTAGFKPDMLSIRQRDPARIEDRLMSMPSNALIERLGAGVMPMPSTVSVGQSALQKTGRELDLALEGEGFLVVRAEPGASGLRLTRDGRMAVASDGTLVTATDGMPFLGHDGRPMRVNPRQPVQIDTDGAVRQNGREVGRMQVSTVPNPERLIKAGSNLLRPSPDEAQAISPAAATLQQGFVESSGTDPIKAMMGVTGASRAVQANTRIIGYINELMGAAVNRLGRMN